MSSCGRHTVVPKTYPIQCAKSIDKGAQPYRERHPDTFPPFLRIGHASTSFSTHPTTYNSLITCGPAIHLSSSHMNNHDGQFAVASFLLAKGTCYPRQACALRNRFNVFTLKFESITTGRFVGSASLTPDVPAYYTAGEAIRGKHLDNEQSTARLCGCCICPMQIHENS